MIEAFRSKTVQKIASNTIYQIIGKLVTLSITVGITVLVTRQYGRIGYGEFNIMQSFPALFFIIVDFGLNAIATRELSNDWQKADKYFSNIITLRLIMSLILIVAAGFSLLFFPYEQALVVATQVSLLLILTQAMFATTNIIFQVKLRYDYSTIGLITGYLAIVLFAFLSIWLDLGVFWINFGYILGGLLTFLVNLYFVKKLGVHVSFDFDKDLIKFLLLESLPLGLMFVFSQINFRSDSILISVLDLPKNIGFNNTESVAIYGLPYKIFEVSLVLPTFFMNSVYPVFVRHMSESKEKLMHTFSRSLLALLIGGIIISICGVLFAPLIVTILGGAEFTQSIAVLRILLGGMFVFYLTQPISWLIVTLGKQIYLPYIYAVSAVFNLVLNLYLIPKYSFYASAYLTWVSEGLILVLLAIAAYKAWKAHYA